MSYFAVYVFPDKPPEDGDHVASTSGWFDWGTWVLARHEEYPEAAHLAQEGWNEGAEALTALEHELDSLLHEIGDRDLAAVSAQVLAAVRALPPGAVGISISDGEPGDGEEE